MKTYYSILMTPIRPAINEQVSVALLMISENKIDFELSSKKLNYLKHLLPSPTVTMIHHYLSGVKQKIESINSELISDIPVIKPAITDYQIFTERYLTYLSNYSNNLITFTKPRLIDLEPTNENFKLLFEKYISNDFIKIHNNAFNLKLDELRNQFYPTIIKRVNIDIDIDRIIENENMVLKSVLPEQINIFGKNEVYISAQLIDFSKKSNNLKADLSYYMNFVNEYPGNNKHFIIGEEPIKNLEKNHIYWNDVRRYKSLTYVNFNEIEKISDYLTEHDVHPVYIESPIVFKS